MRFLSKNKILILILLIVVSLIAIITYQKDHSKNDVLSITSSTNYLVSAQEIDDYQPVAATIESSKKCFGRSRLNGVVTKISVTEGDEVASNQLLATVVDSKLSPQIDSLKDTINAAEIQMQSAQDEYLRYKKLKDSSYISQNDFEKYETAFKVAEANLRALISQREIIENHEREGQVLAPMSGKVSKVLITEGAVVISGENLIELACSSFVIKIRIPEASINLLKLNDNIMVESLGNAVVTKIYPKVEEGTVLVDAELNNIQSSYIGKLVTVHLKTNTHKGFLVPEKYFINRNGMSSLHLKDLGEIIVETGKKNKDMIEVVSGLKENDILVMP